MPISALVLFRCYAVHRNLLPEGPVDGQIAQRIAQALENQALDAAPSAYRSGLQNPDFTDTSSMTSISLSRLDHYNAFVVEGRFANTGAIAVLAVNRFYSPTGTTSFYANGTEIYTMTAGPIASAGKYTALAPFSSYRASGVKVTLVSSITTGTVDLYVTRY